MSFLIHLGIVYIWPVRRIWFTIIFSPFKESLTQFQIWFFFVIFSLFLSQLELSIIELPKLTPNILMENCDHSIFPGWSILFLYAPAHKARLLKNLSSSCNHSQNILRQPLFAKAFPFPLQSMLMGLQITPRLCLDKLLTHNIDLGEGEGILMELSLSFFRENPNKSCFVELSHNFCDCLSEPEKIYWKGKP